MPSHQRLGPDGRHCLHDRWKPPIQLEEEQAITVRELDPTSHLALKHNQLTSQRGILSLKPAVARGIGASFCKNRCVRASL
jgi:hypothetical protein